MEMLREVLAHRRCYREYDQIVQAAGAINYLARTAKHEDYQNRRMDKEKKNMQMSIDRKVKKRKEQLEADAKAQVRKLSKKATRQKALPAPPAMILIANS